MVGSGIDKHMMDVQSSSFSIRANKVVNACDECRARKLRCSGEPTGCARCISDDVPCHYSPRKQMGRPRKRKRGDAVPNQETGSWNLGIVDGREGAESQHALNPNFDMSGALYSMPDENVSLPILNPGSSDPVMHGPPLHANMDGSDDQRRALNFDFPQEFGSNPLMSVPGIADQNLFRPSLPEENDAQTQEPILRLDHPAYAGMETEPAHCHCLAKLYTILGAFQSSPDPMFPYSMVALKKAAQFATEAVRCQICSVKFTSALQNSMLLGTLMNIVIYEYRKLLHHIDKQSMNGEMKLIRMGDNSPGTEHLHTGTPECPMGVNMELSGKEWRNFARRALRKEVLGPGDHCLSQILQEMKDRQQRWHSLYDAHVPQHTATERAQQTAGSGSNPCICVQGLYIDRLRQSLHDCGL